MEPRRPATYLALARARARNRGAPDRLLAEAEVIPGGWPFPLDLQQWSVNLRGLALQTSSARSDENRGRETLWLWRDAPSRI